MATIFKTPTPDQTEKVVEDIPVVVTDKVEATLTEAPKQPTTRHRHFYVASQWHITPTEGVDMIEAVNNSTGDKFEGCIADFNAMLKGDLA